MLGICIITENIEKSLPLLSQLSKDIAIIEFRADALSQHSIDSIQSQLQLLKKNTSLPILFTLRSKREGGNFQNNEEMIFEILHMAIKEECAYIDMEIHWSKENIRNLIKNKGKSKIIASFHNYEKTYTQKGLRHIARRCMYTKADIIRIGMTAQCIQDNMRVFELIDFINKKYKTPIISYCMGDKGRISYVLGNNIGSAMTIVSVDQLTHIQSLQKQLL